MKLPMSGRRWAVLLPLLAIAAWLALFGDKTPVGNGPVVVRPTPQALAETPRPAPKRAVPESVEALVPRRESASARTLASADLFANPYWRAPVPLAVVQPPAPAFEPAPPVALPTYRVLGKKQEGDHWEVYLGRDDQSYIARVGEMIDSIWRVERIEPPSMVLLHVPSGRAQALAIGEAR